MRLLKEVLEDTLDVVSGKGAVALRFSVAKPRSLSALANDSEGQDVVESLAELPDLWDQHFRMAERQCDRQVCRRRFSAPVHRLREIGDLETCVGVGRFTSPDLMVSLIRNGKLDLIGGARPSIADPFLPAKIRQGQVDDIRECIGCNICVSIDAYGLPVRCTQTPTISEEWRRNWHPEALPAEPKRRSHLIAGAGPAGLECARLLLMAGDTVTIADSAREPGGRVALECRLPGLGSWKRVMDYRLGPVMQSARCGLYLDSTMDAQDIAEFESDTVVLAAGSEWRADGVGSTNFDSIEFGDVPVFTPGDIMSGRGPQLPHWATVVYDDDHFLHGQRDRRTSPRIRAVGDVRNATASRRDMDRIHARTIPHHRMVPRTGNFDPGEHIAQERTGVRRRFHRRDDGNRPTEFRIRRCKASRRGKRRWPGNIRIRAIAPGR